MKDLQIFRTIASLLLIFLAHNAQAQENGDILHLQQRWAEVNYQLKGKVQQSEFEHLIAEANQYTSNHPEAAEAWIWSGIIKSTYAGVKGGLGALSYLKQSKAELEKALQIDERALDGSAYTSLGTLYFSVPGWPISFGDHEKAEEMLKKALVLNPDGIDSNYFYARFLIGEKQYTEARNYLHKAQQSKPRSNRALADSGRQKEITLELATIADKQG